MYTMLSEASSRADEEILTYIDSDPFEYILDHKELHDFALQIACGMEFLEKNAIIHR